MRQGEMVGSLFRHRNASPFRLIQDPLPKRKNLTKMLTLKFLLTDLHITYELRFRYGPPTPPFRVSRRRNGRLGKRPLMNLEFRQSFALCKRPAERLIDSCRIPPGA